MPQSRHVRHSRAKIRPYYSGPELTWGNDFAGHPATYCGARRAAAAGSQPVICADPSPARPSNSRPPGGASPGRRRHRSYSATPWRAPLLTATGQGAGQLPRAPRSRSARQPPRRVTRGRKEGRAGHGPHDFEFARAPAGRADGNPGFVAVAVPLAGPRRQQLFSAAHPLAWPRACARPDLYPAGTDRPARMRISGASSASGSAEPAKSAAAPISSRVILGRKCVGRLFAPTGEPRGHMHIGRSRGLDK